MAGSLTKKGLQFGACGFHLGDRPDLRWREHQSHVAGHDPTAHGIIESTPDDEMDLQLGLRCQRPLPVLPVQLLVVEPLQMMWSQSADRDTSK